jgi:arylsulfatase A-like enzyme
VVAVTGSSDHAGARVDVDEGSRRSHRVPQASEVLAGPTAEIDDLLRLFKCEHIDRSTAEPALAAEKGDGVEQSTGDRVPTRPIVRLRVRHGGCSGRGVIPGRHVPLVRRNDQIVPDQLVPVPPNIVLVHSHDIGRHLGCYGRGVETPRLDAIADEGRRFTEYYCSAPTCTPSRAAMNTGRYAHEVGLHGLTHRGWQLDPDVPAIAEGFRDAGYRTRLFGIQHVADGPERLGYESGSDSTRAPEVAAAFELALGDEFGEPGDDPFFATCGFFEPHQPFHQDYVDDRFYDANDPETVDPLPYLPDDRAVREDIAAMNAVIEGAVDPAVGRIDDALHDAGIADDTLLLYTNDHGIPFPRAKGTCYDPGIEGTLIARGPGVEPGTDGGLLSNVDLFPTLYDYADVPCPPVSGRSFAPRLAGDEQDEPRDRVYAELDYHRDYHPTRAVRTRTHKYIRNFDHGMAYHLPTDVITMGASDPVIEDVCATNRPAEELYDLGDDPHEQGPEDRYSLAPAAQVTDPDDAEETAADPETLQTLRSDLHAWMTAHDDPLLDGPLAPPAKPRPPFDA